MSDQDTLTEDEIARRYEATLKRLLAMPPDHRHKGQSGASLKKRGKPAKGDAKNDQP